MINIPMNRQVKNNADLQNVITSAILRQTGDFTREDIYTKVEDNIKFSAFGKYGRCRRSVDIRQMIDKTIDILSTYSCIKKNPKNGELALNKVI